MASFCRWFSNLPLAVTSWARYYICFRKEALFISVLVFGHRFVEYAGLAILITYLNDSWENYNLPKAAVLINVQEGLSSVMMIVIAHISDAYLGRFTVISFSTTAFVLGLVLFWRLNPADNIGLFLVVSVLIALGQAAREPPLKAFLADQLREKDQCPDKERVEARTNFWWRISRFVAAVIATLALDNSSWNFKFKISSIVMGLAFLLFLSCFTCYYREKPTGSPLTMVFRVSVAALSKWRLPPSNEPNDYYKNDSGQLPLLPDISLSGLLDKAALVEVSSLSAEEQEKEGRLCTVKQVKETKLLLRMVPMWATFFVYCLVEATGSTFFFEQSSNMDDRIGRNSKVPLVSLYFIQKFSDYGISYLYELAIPKRWSNARKLCAMKVRVGVGMACACLCCVAARLVEVRRLDLIRKEEFIEVQTNTIDMSILTLVPQFFLLGLMGGLTKDGLVDVFYYQVADSMKSYGPAFNEFVVGIGKFLSIFWVLTFRSWFGETINQSRLDNYYGILATLSLGNLFVVYLKISTNVYKDANGDELSLEAMTEEVVKGVQAVQRR